MHYIDTKVSITMENIEKSLLEIDKELEEELASHLDLARQQNAKILDKQ